MSGITKYCCLPTCIRPSFLPSLNYQKICALTQIVKAVIATLFHYLSFGQWTQAGRYADRQYSLGLWDLSQPRWFTHQFNKVQAAMNKQPAGPNWNDSVVSFSDEVRKELKKSAQIRIYRESHIAMGSTPGRKGIARNMMEDRFLARFETENPGVVPIFGIFDGHNGEETSVWLANNASSYIDESLARYQHDMSDANNLSFEFKNALPIHPPLLLN